MGLATSAAACKGEGSGKGIFGAGESDWCLRAHAVSVAEGSVNGLCTEVVFTEFAFLVKRDGSEAVVREINIWAGGTRIASTRTGCCSAVWECVPPLMLTGQ